MTLPTQNPIPSSAKNDQLFNAEKIDQVVNSDEMQYSDRFGKKRFTFSGLYNIIQTWIASLSDVTGAGAIGIAQGGYVQQSLLEVTPMMQGAVGDGVADDSQALIKTFTIAKTLGLRVKIDRAYLCSSSLTVSGPLYLEGINPETGKIIFTNKDDFGLYITQIKSTDFITIKNISITAGAKIVNPKGLLTIDGSSQLTTDQSAGKYLLADRTIRRGLLDNVNLDCLSGNYAVNYLNIISWMNYSVRNILIRGSRDNLSPLTNGILLNGDGFPVDIHMTDLLMYNLGRAINSVDYVEGLHISEFEFVNVLRGISADYDSNYSKLSSSVCGCYGPMIHTGHVNLGTMTGADSCIYIKNTVTPRIKDLLLFNSAGAAVTNSYGVYVYGSTSGGEISSVYVAGGGAANTKTNNYSIRVYGANGLNIKDCTGSYAGAVVYLEGVSTNCVISGNSGISTTNVVYVFSASNANNKITSDNSGIGITDKVVGGDPSGSYVEPLIWQRKYTLNLAAAKDAGTSFTFNVPIPGGNFGVAPDAAFATLPSNLIGQFSYNPSASSATSLNVTIYFISAAGIGSYDILISAAGFGVSRTQ